MVIRKCAYSIGDCINLSWCYLLITNTHITEYTTYLSNPIFKKWQKTNTPTHAQYTIITHISRVLEPTRDRTCWDASNTRVLLLSHSNLRTIFYLRFQNQLAMTSHHCVKPMRNKNMYNLNFN